MVVLLAKSLLRMGMSLGLIASFISLSTASPVVVSGISQQQAPFGSGDKKLKVPGNSPAYHCSDPTDDIFLIKDLTFNPTNPHVGYYQYIQLWGHFIEDTGALPWLTINATINGDSGHGPIFDKPLCDIDVFQEIEMEEPGHNNEPRIALHRACPPNISPGYTQINSPAIPLYPYIIDTGHWKLRAQATTQDGRRIFCVEGEFDVEEY